MIGELVTRKLIPAVVPLYFLIAIILGMLGYIEISGFLLLIPILVMMYFATAELLPIDDIAEKLKGRQRD